MIQDLLLRSAYVAYQSRRSQKKFKLTLSKASILIKTSDICIITLNIKVISSDLNNLEKIQCRTLVKSIWDRQFFPLS
ncbi:hypothetical protein EV05_1883 [Prochlorococcus sp. MIT 0601]|nr:hypothetical protein EV05_1883 [Prochlorococcus sp. MIT 0601]